MNNTNWIDSALSEDQAETTGMEHVGVSSSTEGHEGGAGVFMVELPPSVFMAENQGRGNEYVTNWLAGMPWDSSG